MIKQEAVLLLGPSASGKTPLGQLLAKTGLKNRRCVHFDFGAWLRLIAQGQAGSDFLSPKEIGLIRQALAANRLLANGEFGIANKIFSFFLSREKARDDYLVILNGLPRHLGQAKDMAELVKIVLVICLECSREVLLARIKSNIGGDRDGRPDDSPADIEAKLMIYFAENQPLIAYFWSCGTPMVKVSIGAQSQAEDIRQYLESRDLPFKW